MCSPWSGPLHIFIKVTPTYLSTRPTTFFRWLAAFGDLFPHCRRGGGARTTADVLDLMVKTSWVVSILPVLRHQSSMTELSRLHSCIRMWCVAAVDGRIIEASRGSSVTLGCRHPSLVNHAEWDFHRHNVGTPVVLFDGSVVNPILADKYQVNCNLSSSSSTVCDLRINRLKDADVGTYQCYLLTDDETSKFVYRLSLTGTKERSHRTILSHLSSYHPNWTILDRVHSPVQFSSIQFNPDELRWGTAEYGLTI